MKFTDVVSLTKSAVAQTMGTEYMDNAGDLSALDSYKLVDIGKDVLESGHLDIYCKSLLTQIGKMVIDSNRYKAELPSLFIDTFDWGGYIERVYFAPQDIVTDDMWNLVDGKSYDDHKFYKPNVKAKIFEDGKAIVTPISVVTEQLKTAFSGMSQMNAFLSGIHTNISNTIELAMESYAHMVASCGIAISTKSTKTARHLITEFYGAESGKTSADALEDTNFLIYAMKQISMIKSNMARYTTAFNNKAIPTFTNASDCKMALLNHFTSAIKFDLKANTYNEKELNIGDYDTVSSWQAFKDTDEPDFSFATSSTIDISADSENKLGCGKEEVKVSNCIGIIYDTRAMGICPYRSKVTSNYTAVADFWNEYYHTLVNYIIDANYNMVALLLD